MDMNIGYARVSKSDGSQHLDLQIDALIKAGVSEDRIYADKISSRKDNRPGLEECLKALQPGNTLVVWKLDRLGRDLKELVNLIDDFNKKDIGLKVLSGTGASIDTSTANGKLIFGIFASLAEFERELIRERTLAGLTAARARGRMGGRPRKMDKTTLNIAVSALKQNDCTVQDVAKRLKITTTTLYMYLNGDGSLKEEGVKLLINN